MHKTLLIFNRIANAILNIDINTFYNFVSILCENLKLNFKTFIDLKCTFRDIRKNTKIFLFLQYIYISDGENIIILLKQVLSLRIILD